MPSNLAAITLQQVVATRNPATRMGPFNRQHYSNPELDQVLLAAMQLMDQPRRDAETARAMAIAMDDVAVIPYLLSARHLGWPAREGPLRRLALLVHEREPRHARQLRLSARETGFP
jgi:peptide/nickel transport system substrate-binding protein